MTHLNITRFNDYIVSNMHELIKIDAKPPSSPEEWYEQPRGIFYSTHYEKWLEKSIQDASKKKDKSLMQSLIYHKMWLIQPHAFLSGYTNSPFFERIKEKGFVCPYKPFAWRLKPNCLPSEALDQLTTSAFSLIDSSLAIQIVFYKSLLSFLGSERFNALFKKNRLILSFDRFVETLKLFYKPISPSPQEGNIERGDILKIANVSSYLFKHPWGNSQSYNVICDRDHTDKDAVFISLSPDDNKGKYTHPEICAFLRADFNQPPKELAGENFTHHSIKKMQKTTDYQEAMRHRPELENKQLTLQEFFQKGGGKMTGIRILEPPLTQLYSIPNSIPNLKWVSNFLDPVNKKPS